jgi:hypothetical protein
MAEPKLESLRKMDIGANVHDLIRIGERAADYQCKQIEEQIPTVFNLPG